MPSIKSPIPSPVCYTPFYKNKSLLSKNSFSYQLVNLLYYKAILEDVNLWEKQAGISYLN